MSTVHGTRTSVEGDAVFADDTEPIHPLGHYAMGCLRIVIGLTFLWAFFDKLLALGYSTGRDDKGVVDRFGDAAWIHGSSPTEGFLKYGAKGPFKGFYNSLAGNPVIDWLFMAALLGIGIAFTFGIFTRLAAAAGALLYLMMWSVYLPPDQNPVLDDHIIGVFVCLVLGFYAAGRYLGIGRWWERTAVAQKYPILK